jgi:hypothetical protein
MLGRWNTSRKSLVSPEGARLQIRLSAGRRYASRQNTILFPKKLARVDGAVFEQQVQIAKYIGGTPQLDGAGMPTAVAVALPKLGAPVMPTNSESGSSKTQPKKKKEVR